MPTPHEHETTRTEEQLVHRMVWSRRTARTVRLDPGLAALGPARVVAALVALMDDHLADVAPEGEERAQRLAELAAQWNSVGLSGREDYVLWCARRQPPVDRLPLRILATSHGPVDVGAYLARPTGEQVAVPPATTGSTPAPAP